MIPTANPTPAQLAAMEAENARIWARAGEQPYKRDGRDEFEPDVADWGRCQDDDEQADRAADREWAARWER